MFPKTLQGKILFVSVCVNILLIAVLVVWFVAYKDYEHTALAASHAEARARLHSGILALQNFKENQTRPPEELIRELKVGEATAFLDLVDSLVWVEDRDASRDESLVRLKEKLRVAREFIAANPDLFSTNSVK